MIRYYYHQSQKKIIHRNKLETTKIRLGYRSVQIGQVDLAKGREELSRASRCGAGGEWRSLARRTKLQT